MWAATQNFLGDVYIIRIQGDRAENLENAIAAYQAALHVYTRDAFPQNWAMTQNDLGGAYLHRIRGDRVENLEMAIAAHQNALQIYTRDEFPQDWAETQGRLGNVYSYRIRGGRAKNLEAAIAASQAALQVYTRDAFPKDWANVQISLGEAYRLRVPGDSPDSRNNAENLEQAIACYQAALQIYTRDEFPEDWAIIQNNLGETYQARIQGNRTENLEKAIAFYQAALQVRTRDKFPQKWAGTQGNLAALLVDRAEVTGNLEDLDKGIQLFQEAVQVIVPGTDYYVSHPYFLSHQWRLGNALTRRYEHSQNPEDLRGAMAAYKAALDAISPEHWDRPQIWQAIPQTQTILGSRLVRQGQWQEGLELLLNSVRQLSTSDDKQAHANALYQTGRAHETLADWENARLYYRDALRLYDHLSDTLGIAHCKLGLGSVLASQGYLEKGLAELETARELYQQLHQGDRAAQVNDLIQAAQMALDSQSREAFV